MILSSLKSKTRAKKTKYIDPTLIPYVSHYDENNILTKCGSLMQVIKISNSLSNKNDTQEKIRSIVSETARTYGISFWFFNKREQKNIVDKRKDVGDASDIIHNGYANSSAKVIFTNTLYIAMVTMPFFESKLDILDTVSMVILRKRHDADLKNKKTLLNKLSASMKEALQKEFDCKTLGFEFTEDHVYSEALELINSIMQKNHRKIEVGPYDISMKLSEFNIDFSSTNSFKIIENHKSKVGVILEIKNYHKISKIASEKLMQVECDMLITEHINFLYTRKDLEKYIRQSYVATISRDDELLMSSGLYDYLEAIGQDFESRPFCAHKAIITISAKNEHLLKTKIEIIANALAKIGLLAIRHDLRLEEAYFMNLPGNFVFATKSKLIPSNFVPSFTELNSEIQKNNSNLKNFQIPVATFFTARNNPYKISFQNKDTLGHTLIIGPDPTFRTSIVNLMLSGSREFNSSILIFDANGLSEIFVKVMQGKYVFASLDPKINTLKINPFMLENNEFNKDTIVGILKRMVGRTTIPDEMVQQLLERASTLILESDYESRTISSVQEILKVFGNDALQWLEGGIFAHFLTNKKEEESNLYGINFSQIMKTTGCAQVLLYHLIRKFQANKVMKNKIVVVDEFFQMCSIFYNIDDLKNWITQIIKSNSIAILASGKMNGKIAERVCDFLYKNIEQIIMLPNSNMIIDNSCSEKLHISQENKTDVLKMPSLNSHLLVKIDDESKLVSTSIKDIKEDALLCSTPEMLKFMNEATNEAGNEINDWLPVFFKKCKIFYS